MQPQRDYGKITIGASLIGCLGAIVASIIGGYFLLQAAQLSSQANQRNEGSLATATAVAQISPPPPPTYIPYPTPLPPTPYPTSTPRPTATPYPTYTPPPTFTPRPTPAVPLPFSDNFDNGISRFWTKEGGDWNMANGELTNSMSDGVIWFGKSDWTDIVVEVDVRRRGCSYLEGQFVEVLIRMQDARNYVAARTSCYVKGLFLIRNGQEQKQMVSAPPNPDSSHWKIEVMGSIYRIFTDGQLRGTASDETFSSGSVGIRMSQGAIDNLTIRPYLP